MKRVLVLCPNAWDKEGLAHPKVRENFRPLFVGEELLETPTLWNVLTFDIFRYAHQQAKRARQEGAEGIVGTGDYPGCMLAAMVASELGLPGPRTRDVVLLSHKYYSREIQQRVVPEATPRFSSFDPYSRPLPSMPLPAFVKPVKGTMSIRARSVSTRVELEQAVRFTLAERLRAHLLMRPFRQLLRTHSDQKVPAHHFIAESPLSGAQVTVDGFVQKGKVTLMGVVDSVMYPGTQNFERFEYPSRLPAEVQRRMLKLVGRLMAASGLDHSCFNVEVFYDAARDHLSLIEINPRMSYQFADLYERVDGTHTYQLQLALSVGDPADWKPGRGADRAAASFVMRRFSDAKVLATPDSAELDAVANRFPGTTLKLLAHEGDQLSDHDQDVGSYRYGIVNMSAPSAVLLHERYRTLKSMLSWRFDAEEAAAARPHTDERKAS